MTMKKDKPNNTRFSSLARFTLRAFAWLVICTASVQAATIIVPDDFASIQDAVDASSNGDDIMVRPGTYHGMVEFFGKSVVLYSEQGPEVTIIDGMSGGAVVKFRGGEDDSTVLTGFTITNGMQAGILCDKSSPRIIKNIITGNTRTNNGGGIYCKGSCEPLIMSNEIHDNSCTGAGGGIGLNGSDAVIKYNLIHDNDAGNYGGGISCYNDSLPEIAYNIVCDNTSGLDGGGVHGGEIIKGNLIVGNHAERRGGGVCACSLLINNTVCSNSADDGGGVQFAGTGINNIIRENTANTGPEYSTIGSPEFFYCNVKGGAPGTANIDADPLFKDPANMDYRLSQDPVDPGVVNPCVDAGDPSSEAIEGSTRSDGYPDTGVIDIGYHYTGDIHFIPFNHATIQQAIDAAPDWDTIIVFPGTYAENLDFGGKSIRVISDAGPESTIVDGRQIDSVVVFDDREGEFSILEGFTLINGNAYQGGGIHCFRASPRIQRNIIERNTADHGGGIYVYSGEVVLSSNIIAENSATGRGGGVYCNADASIVNCTVCRNSAGSEGGGVYLGRSDAVICNTVIWGNEAPSQPDLFLDLSYPTITFSNIKGGWPGTGNIDAAPEFKNALQGDYRLRHTSPCVDTGYSGASDIGQRDFEGDQRIRYWAVDIGADEFLIEHLFVVPDLYPNIQQAIDDAVDADIIHVKPGIYRENIDFLGKTITVKSTAGPALTIIDGMQQGSAVTFSEGMAGHALLEGFTITNGTGNHRDSSSTYGGGVDCRNSKATVNDCIISANRADFGGGICVSGDRIHVENNLISENEGLVSGGGIIVEFGDRVEIANNTIAGNEAALSGGGLFYDDYYWHNRDSVVDNLIVENEAGIEGGGAYLAGNLLLVSNNQIADNVAGFAGAGLLTYDMEGSEVSGNTIARNIVLTGEGGAAIDVRGRALNNLFADNIIFNNQATAGIGGISFEESWKCNGSAIVNCTIVDNSTFGVYGGFFDDPSIANSIVWNNGYKELWWLGTTQVTYCNVKGGYSGVGNINVDPAFADPAAGDYHLTYGSPCINAGYAYSTVRPEDFEGDSRTGSGGVDMGADEFRHHLYHLGTVQPGRQIQIAVVGPPGTNPVYLLAANSYVTYTQWTPYGNLYLIGKITHFNWGAIPPNGILKKAATVPAWWSPGREFPFQALVGPPGDPATVLTNLLVLEVDCSFL